MRVRLIILSIFLIFSSAHAIAADNDSEHKAGKFDPAEFIFEHVGDAHEWHIVTFNNHHISIPLPVIIYSKKSGLHIFLSNKFHHNHGVYQNFKLAQEGQYKGKIVELNSKGEIDENYPLPYDFSITKNVLAIFITSILLLVIFINIANTYKKNPDSPPKGLQNVFEPFILFVRNEIAIPSIGEKKYHKYLPFLLSIFFFIWFSNLLGLIPIFPGGANVTGNISVTMALAIFAFFVINTNANKEYWKHIVNPPGIPGFLKLPIPIIPFVEFLAIFIKPFVLMVRLFANILAGHMVAVVLLSLIFIFSGMIAWLGFAVAPISILFLIFMSLLELLVALIQAYVFTLLTALYIGMATEEHH
ncbi:MAG: F-type H+-transporting ATPase subunit a [Tenuifilum sp.]|jgi:F-type H+-transporting ATPase subunit a|uniref:F0F1 ATP synthase subunit A n=1 Tax=Tenuifilum sp. TaxID=2760880 RepID=UPI0024AC162E|nr:F0F1 ATP synthase subunit A [Tenuifilum sp.]MDI3527062.1 F-type H+-transporting ATPase subunit a [Tenuifilum sp.]